MEQPHRPSNHRTRAVVMLLLTTAAWGFSFPGGKALMMALEAEAPGRSSWMFASLVMAGRFGVGALILWLMQPRQFGAIKASEWRQGVGLGVFGGLGMLLQTDGLAHTAASTSAFLTQFTAVLVPAAVAFRDRQRPSVFIFLCVAMVMAGCAILGGFDWRELRAGRGEIETLLAAFFFTGQILWLEWRAFRGNDSGRVTFVMFLTVSAMLVPVFLWHAPTPAAAALLVQSAPVFAVFMGLTAICSVLAFRLMNRWQPEVDASSAGIIYCAEPLFATAFALVLPAILGAWLGVPYPNEAFTRHLVIGGGLITIANILIAIAPAPRRRE